jgi:hypothetical protein
LVGSFDYNPYPPQLALDAIPIGVFLYDRGQGYALLPNIRCDQIQYKEGIEPPAARLIRDYDATNRPWPEVVAELLRFYGFGMRWVCTNDGNGQPYDYLEVYRKDAAGPIDPKQLYLPPSGSDLSTALANVSAMHATRQRSFRTGPARL